MLNIGDVLNGCYQITEQLGKGGIGTVYKAVHLRLGRDIVVKTMDTANASPEKTRHEADILKNLKHTYLPQVFDIVWMEDGTVYTVLDFVPGKDLQSYIDEGIGFDTNTIFRWMHQLCEALDYLHSQDPPIIHSDIKPGNIMIKPNGDICLIDFNVSLEKGQLLQGISEMYSAPEQYQYACNVMNGIEVDINSIDCRSDIYSLGATFYQLMSGHLPTVVLENMLPLSAYDLIYPDYLVEIVEKCLQPNPKKRYQKVKHIIKALDNSRRQDKRLKHQRVVRVLLNLIFAVTACLGLVIAYFGYCTYRLESFAEKYEQYSALVKDWTDAEIIEKSEQLLADPNAEMSMEHDEEAFLSIYHNIANAARNEGKNELAEQYYRKLVEYDYSDVYIDYALCLLQKDETEEAQVYIVKAQRAEADNGIVYYCKGLVAEKEFDIAEAVKCYKMSLLSLDPQSEYYLLAEKYLEEND